MRRKLRDIEHMGTLPPLAATVVGIGMLVCVTLPAHADKPDWLGIWDWGTNLSREEVPPLKGKLIFSFWRDIEPEPGVFDFSKMDSRIRSATVDRDLYVMVKVYIGHKTPQWVYQHGVPEVRSGDQSFPYYLDDDFKRYLKRMITRVSAHVDTYPPAIRDRIVAVQGPMGNSGDEGPWPYDTLDRTSPYYIDPAAISWRDYTREIGQHYHESYKDKAPAVVLFLNFKETNHVWAIDALAGAGRKATKVNQGHAFNDEMLWNWRRAALTRFHGEYAVRARGEHTHAVRRQARGQWFFDAPVWNMYWQVLSNLAYGFDVLNAVYTGAAFVEDRDWSAHEPAWHFFNKYAGYKDPKDSKGAWIALRDSLDVKDTTRFAENQFGAVQNGNNAARYAAVAAHMSAYGAMQGDPEHQVLKNTAYYLDVDFLNDVNYNVWPGNYAMFMTQIAPLETSQGYWRVGDKSERFGRFARGFNHQASKDAMAFDIADGFFFDKPLDGAYPITIRVVYFDDGTGSWQLKYDAIGQTDKVAFSVTKTDSGKWKERLVVLEDAYFGNRGPNGADLVLFNSDAEDDVFHMIEATRETGDRRCFWGYGVFPDPNCDPGSSSDQDATVPSAHDASVGFADQGGADAGLGDTVGAADGSVPRLSGACAINGTPGEASLMGLLLALTCLRCLSRRRLQRRRRPHSAGT